MKTLEQIAIFLHFVLAVDIANAQSVLITPTKSSVSDTLMVKNNLGVGSESISNPDNRLEVKANGHASFFIQNSSLVANNITGEDLILSIYALCIMPYLGIAYIKAKENRNDEAMTIFLQQRREKIKEFVTKSLKP
jgi:hypothetical protein